MASVETKWSLLQITFWVLLGLLIFFGLLSGIAAIYWREELKEFSNPWGNFASVLGLWLGFIAFLVTILTLLLVAHAEKKAVREVEQRTEAAVERIGMLVLETECDSLGRSVKHIQGLIGKAMGSQNEADWRPLWEQIVERCRECADMAGDLLALPFLTAHEKEEIEREMGHLGQIASFIERNRLPDKKNGTLPDQHTTTLVRLFMILTTIRHRVRSRVYEAINGSRQ